jgi:hypothetical protein
LHQWIKCSSKECTAPEHGRKYETKLKLCGDNDVKYRVYPWNAAAIAQKIDTLGWCNRMLATAGFAFSSAYPLKC